MLYDLLALTCAYSVTGPFPMLDTPGVCADIDFERASLAFRAAGGLEDA